MRYKFAALGAALLLLASCRNGHRRRIAVIPKATSHLYWVSVQAGVMAAGKQFDVDVIWNGPALETQYDRQVQIVDSMVAQQVDGLAVAAAERRALVAPVERAVDAGIPVVIFDSGLDSSRFMSYIATDNVEAGRKAARELARELGGQGRVAILMNAPGSVSTMDRERGFEDELKQFPAMQVVARQYGMADRSKAMAAAENILTAHPDLNGIFASSEPSSTGTALALRSRGLNGRIQFVAFDAGKSMIDDLRAGVISAMVVQDPFRMGYESVRAIVDKLNGKAPPKRIDLQARVIKRSDLEDPKVRQILMPDVNKYLSGTD